MPPERPDLVLSSDVPDVELDILVRDGLDVEADCWDRRHALVQLELVEDRCTRTKRTRREGRKGRSERKVVSSAVR
jgi:hypothetical protein